ncbi:hypothetical protein Tco_0304611 [Tanacetum coccineum]
MSTILALSYPSSNNQLEISSNPMHQVAMPERQTLSYVGNCSTGNDHIARPYTQSKKIQCLKQQMLLAQLQEAGIQLSKDQLAILADTRERIDFWPMCFQHDNMHSSKQMELSYGSDALAEVHNPDNVDNNMINQGVQKAQQLEPKLYDGKVIKNTSAIVISDSEETLMLAKEIRSKMLLKQQDPMVLEKKVNTTPVDYVNSMNSSDSSPSCRPTKVEVPKELPKVSMVNMSLKILKHHLSGFDVVVKERTTATAITEGSDNSVSNQNAPNFDQYFELNELKAQSQEKDTVIKKLKERIKSLSGNMNKDKVKKDIEEIETINIELDHKVSKLIAENEHLKQTYKQLYDSIKPTRIRSKEECDALIAQINAKSVENSDLNAQLQEKVLAITALKEELRKLKGKSVITCRESVNKPKVFAPVVHKVDLEPLSLNLKNNREAHKDYIRITKENANTLRDIVEQARTSNPLDNALAYACMYTKQIQELLVYVSDTCPSSPLKSEKLVPVTPMNKARKVTFAKTSTTSDNNIQIQVDVHQTQTTSKPLVPSTNEKCATNASRSKPRSETKNNMIMQPLSSSQKSQKIEAHTRNAKPSLTKEDRLVQNLYSSTPNVPPSKRDCDILFQPLFDEYFNPTPCVVSLMLPAAAPLPVDSTATPSSTIIDQDVPYASTSLTNQEIQSQVIYQGGVLRRLEAFFASPIGCGGSDVGLA